MTTICSDVNSKFGLCIGGGDDSSKGSRESNKRVTAPTVRRYIKKGKIGASPEKKGISRKFLVFFLLRWQSMQQ